jgi:hypothetical protein
MPWIDANAIIQIMRTHPGDKLGRIPHFAVMHSKGESVRGREDEFPRQPRVRRSGRAARRGSRG